MVALKVNNTFLTTPNTLYFSFFVSYSIDLIEDQHFQSLCEVMHSKFMLMQVYDYTGNFKGYETGSCRYLALLENHFVSAF